MGGVENTATGSGTLEMFWAEEPATGSFGAVEQRAICSVGATTANPLEELDNESMRMGSVDGLAPGSFDTVEEPANESTIALSPLCDMPVATPTRKYILLVSFIPQI